MLNPPHPGKRTTDGQGLLLLRTDEGHTEMDRPQGTDGNNQLEQSLQQTPYYNVKFCLQKTPLRFLAIRRVPTTSTVGVEAMSTAKVVYATVEGFPTPSLPKQSDKPDYASIKETHQLLTENTASIMCDLSGGHNGYLSLTLQP